MEFNSTMNAQRVRLGSVLPLDTPFTVLLDVSEVCNLKCNYCFRSWDIKEYGYALKNDLMSFETLKLAVEQIKEFPNMVKKISLSGHGEPMCNPQLPEMAKYIKDELKTVTEIHTNATLLSAQNIDRYANAEITRFIISLQGLDAKVYERICGHKIDFIKFLSNIKALYGKSKNDSIFVKIVDVALAEGEEETFYNTFKDICHRIYIEKAQDIWTDTVDSPKQKELIINKFGYDVEYQHCCSGSFYTLFVTPSGDVYPCLQPLIKLKLGNIHTTTLKEMWNSNLRKEFLVSQLKEGRSSLSDCKNCNISQNTICSKLDSINDYRDEILKRIEGD